VPGNKFKHRADSQSRNPAPEAERDRNHLTPMGQVNPYPVTLYPLAVSRAGAVVTNQLKTGDRIQ